MSGVLNVPFVIQSIAGVRKFPTYQLVEMFPHEAFDTDRPGLVYLPTKSLFEPFLDQQQLYRERSHWHWTAFAHEQSGQLILERGLLERSVADHQSAPPP